MSELMNARSGKRDFRWQLLTTVSALALLAAVGMGDAKAADEEPDRPTVWIELGGQAENITGQGERFAPAFLAAYPNSTVLGPVTPIQAQKPSQLGFGEEGTISFQPEGSDWVFSAALRYGQSSNTRHVDHQGNGVHQTKYVNGVPVSGHLLTVTKFADTHAHNQETHAVLDFLAGKDVGLGMFGKDSSSVLSLGVRFAQFASKETFDIRARPDLHFKYLPAASAPTRIALPYFHTYHASGNASRSFRGIGPSLSWTGSTPFVGNQQGGEITFDWGVNAALLFGKQKAHVRHQETGNYKAAGNKYYSTVYQHPPTGHDTLRSVTVPNVGGFAGLSWRIRDFKVNLGYRADFFFGAIDAGIDTRKSEMLGFYGPFASVSVGLGG